VSFQELVAGRWLEACKAVGADPAQIDFSWGYGDDYDHFKKKRGFAVCFMHDGGRIRLLFSTKIFDAPRHRQDALVRHEIAHAIDFLTEEDWLDEWAACRLINLPSTPERRADALAEAIWREPIKYDKDLVQSTMFGTFPRPEKLGL